MAVEEMVVAAGGRIKQTVVRDDYSQDIWEPEATKIVNIQASTIYA